MMNQTYNPAYGQFAGQQMTYGMQPMPGVAFTGQTPTFTNPLGKNTIDQLLREGNGAPKLQITQEDLNQAICTHRLPDTGQLMTYQLPNGKQKCKICGAEFNLVEDASQEDVQQCTDNLHDILHTTKILWMDVPDKIAQDNFQILAVVDQAPLIFSIASDRFQKYVGVNPISQQNQVNGFAMLNNITGTGMPMYGNPMMQQPMYAAPQNYPYGQPMGFGNYGMNAGMVNQPMMGMQPMNPGMTPMQQTMVQDAPGLVNNGFGYVQQQPGAAVNVQPNNVQQAPAQQTPQSTGEQQAPTDNKGGAQVTQQLHV